MLVFGSHIARPASAGSPRRNAIDGVESFLVRPAEIIGDCLPEMVAVGERLARDIRETGINRFHLGTRAFAANTFEFAAKFRFEKAVEFLGSRFAVALA